MKITILLLCLFSFLQSFNSLAATRSDKSVLYIGDSQSAGFLGRIVFDHLKKSFKEDNLQVYGVSSSSPRHWAPLRTHNNSKWLCKQKGRFNNQFQIPLRKHICDGPQNTSIFHQINKNHPHVVIFQFLGNSVGWSETFIRKQIEDLLAELKNQKCLFITSPPNYLGKNKKKRLETEGYILDAVSSRCDTVQGMTEKNLRDFARNRKHYQGDKMHLSKQGALAFFEQIKPKLPQ